MYENKKEATLGAMIKSLLKEHSLSMRKLSTLTGIDIATISRIVNSKQPANINHLQKFAESLNIPIEQLLIAGGYSVGSSKKEVSSNTHNIVDAIQEMLKSSNLLEQQYDLRRIQEELNKYEQYAITKEGKGIIHNSFNEKINNINGSGLFIDQLKQMYKQFCDDNITTDQQGILGSGLLYFILSTDIIPDYIFPIGYLDDVIAVKLVLDRLAQIKESKQTEVPPAI